ncbi:uncharacterized protein LOC113795690 [Dermatophagoides pteronyssinus]|uniref:uncharacterized protein LOC113795690 n=1 Tax=Dermatophagoides pteronyssinus TaxID=6956 RepID=UPI003F66958A
MSTLKRNLKQHGTVLPDNDVQGIFRQLESPNFFNYDNSNYQQQQSTSSTLPSPMYSPTKDNNNGDSKRFSDNDHNNHQLILDVTQAPISYGRKNSNRIESSKVDDSVNDSNNQQKQQEDCSNDDRPFIRAHLFRRSFSLDDIVQYQNRAIISCEHHENIEPNMMIGQPYHNQSAMDVHLQHIRHSQNPHGKISHHQNWLGGVFGCFKPIIGIISSKGFKDGKNNCEIPYENLKDMQFLGSGAQGSVYVATLNQELVAVKKMREKCETEIKHLRKLNHKNIVAFKGVCTQSANYCIVMEFCPYGQLYEYLKKCEYMPPAQVIDWSHQIASGMNYLHQHKIIHRDLKSPNVLISNNSVLKISDFGTSRQLSDCSKIMSFAGTVAWMAPEVIRSELCSEKVDIWSFGVVLWELLTLEIPYRDFEQSTIIYGVGNSNLSLPLPESFPKGYRLLMQMSWKNKPRNRPSFQQIIAHIEIASREFNDIKLEEFRNKQRIWKEEVRHALSLTRINFNNQQSLSSSSQVAGSPVSECSDRLKSKNKKKSLNHLDQLDPTAHLDLDEPLQSALQSAMIRKTASLYTDMVKVIESLVERERKICESENGGSQNGTEFSESIRNQSSQKPLTEKLLEKALNDPIYKSALELSRESSKTNNDLNDSLFVRALESPIRQRGGSQYGSVKAKLRRRNRRLNQCYSSSSKDISFSMADSQDTTAQENSIALDDCNDLISIPIDLINKSNEQQDLVTTTTTNQSNNQTQMIRGVPQRRTFDSGYGEGQSCISSPIAEPKKNCNGNGNGGGNISASSANTSASLSGQRIRARLRRQKAIDRSSCPSSGLSSNRSRPMSSSYHQQQQLYTANSSTDYEDNDYDDDDDNDYNSLYSRRSSSVGRIHEFGTCHAYGRLRRKTSAISSSDNDNDDDDDDNDIDDEGKTSSSDNDDRLKAYNIAIIKRKLKASLPSSSSSGRKSTADRRPYSGGHQHRHHHHHNHHHHHSASKYLPTTTTTTTTGKQQQQQTMTSLNNEIGDLSPRIIS